MLSSANESCPKQVLLCPFIDSSQGANFAAFVQLLSGGNQSVIIYCGRCCEASVTAKGLGGPSILYMVQCDFDPSAFPVPHESLEDAHNMTGLRCSEGRIAHGDV